jgi:hypothetical protein
MIAAKLCDMSRISFFWFDFSPIITDYLMAKSRTFWYGLLYFPSYPFDLSRTDSSISHHLSQPGTVRRKKHFIA